MLQQWCPGRFSSPPQKRPGTKANGAHNQTETEARRFGSARRPFRKKEAVPCARIYARSPANAKYVQRCGTSRMRRMAIPTPIHWVTRCVQRRTRLVGIHKYMYIINVMYTVRSKKISWRLYIHVLAYKLLILSGFVVYN